MKKSNEYIQKLTNMDKSALKKLLESAKKDLSKYYLIKSVGKENNNRKHVLLKNNIAIINTFLSRVENEK